MDVEDLILKALERNKDRQVTNPMLQSGTTFSQLVYEVMDIAVTQAVIKLIDENKVRYDSTISQYFLADNT